MVVFEFSEYGGGYQLINAGLPAEPPVVMVATAIVSPHVACLTCPTIVGAGVTVVFTTLLNGAQPPGGFI